MNNKSTLTIKNLSASYGKKLIIKNVSLQPISAGRIIALVGSNGAGKSTFLRAISGLLPAQGNVILEQLDLKQQDLLSLPDLARAQHFGLMPQNIPLGNSLNVFETIMSALMATKSEISMQQAYLLSANMLEKLNLADFANSALNQLSGGQRQMVSLAQALVRNPDILLLDEPTSALDMRRQFFVMQNIRQLANEGKYIFIVVHDLSLAARWADHIILLHRGELYCEGTPQQSITPDVLAAVYGVQARVMPCSKGYLQIMVDGLI